MMSMHNVASSGQALAYFSDDNYYTQDQGLEHSEWFGEAATELGLSGKVDKEGFFQALNGQLEGQELGKWVKGDNGELQRDHRPGTDMTFSAPKSVSLMAVVHGAIEVRQAHEEAVKTALSYVEKELAQTRQTVGGTTEATKTGNIAVAMFRHNTSRDLDPQTHTHAVIINATKREDGEWRSLTNDEIYKAQKTIGAIYSAELADRLQSLGYKIERTDDKGNFEIAGISREQIEHFSSRRAAIEEALIAKGINPDTATAKEREAATLKTRARKVDVDHAQLIGEWKDQARAVGIDLAAIQAQAKVARESGGVDRSDKLTGRQALEFAAAHLYEREAVNTKQDILATAIQHGAGRVSPKEILAAFNKLESQGHLVKLPDGNFTTRKMLGSEEWALEQVQAGKGATAAIMPAEAMKQRLDQAETAQGFKFSQGQREAISMALTSNDRFVAVQGLAGTGKTTMLKALNTMAQEQGYTIRGMAPTGAASKVLALETGMPTNTVAMFQIKERQLQKDIEYAKEFRPDFQRKDELWVVDESSFLSQRQKSQLDSMAIKAGAKVVYLGDTLQLQGVEAGKPFELAQKAGMTTAYMTEIARQKTPELQEAVGIITGKDKLVEGERLTAVELNSNSRAFAYLDKTGRVQEFGAGTEGPTKALVRDLVSMEAGERDRTIVITAYNKDREAINNGVRAGLQAAGLLSTKEDTHQVLVGKDFTRAMKSEAQYYKAGDVVRFGRDYKQVDAKDGEYARVVAVNAQAGIVTVRKDDGTELGWQPKVHKKIEVYEAEYRQLSVGDKIRITRNEGKLKNGEVGRVDAVNGTQVQVTVGKGKAAEVHTIDLAKNRHWDHAYASTVHASQGATEHRAVFHIRAPETTNETRDLRALVNMAKVFGNRSFYVGATRASHDVQIYTNNKDMARRAVGVEQDKSSAVETLNRSQIGKADTAKSPSLAR